MKNKDGRCQNCFGFDADSGECTAYRPWGFYAMEEDGCTFFNFHEDRRMKMFWRIKNYRNKKPSLSNDNESKEKERDKNDFLKERKEMCKGCKYFEFSETIGSPNEKVWHCRDGFTPSKDCKDMAAYNDKCRKAYYREYPNELQLKIRF